MVIKVESDWHEGTEAWRVCEILPWPDPTAPALVDVQPHHFIVEEVGAFVRRVAASGLRLDESRPVEVHLAVNPLAAGQVELVIFAWFTIPEGVQRAGERLVDEAGRRARDN